MEFKSVKDILEFSISKEEASVQFYQDLSLKVGDVALHTLFDTLASTEKKHIEQLQLELTKMGYVVKTKDEEEPVYLWEEKLDIGDQIRQMNYVDALVVAIQKERAAFRLYTQILGATKNKQFTAVLMELAEEEMRHVLLLEREYDAVTHRKE